jgi:hypothetical protein
LELLILLYLVVPVLVKAGQLPAYTNTIIRTLVLEKVSGRKWSILHHVDFKGDKRSAAIHNNN